MKRLIVLLVSAAVLVIGAVALVFGGQTQTEPRSASQFERVSLPFVNAPVQPPPAPKAKFTRTIWTSTKLNAIDAALDQCRGPVSADLGEGEPIFVAEHDYCGGRAWMWKLDVDDAVALKGEGVDAGLYVVSELKYFPRKSGAQVSDLPPGEVVLQTCVSATRMVFIALKKYEVVG
ncbi:MAG: hypothetical protein M3Q98_11130 [Actinomycetota bacterium]|nr:hypothetical protein [Actinomycetota bacterium]